MMCYKTGIIIQTRMGSTRLPGKVLLDLNGKTVLEHVVNRCNKTNADIVIVATTTNKKDEPIINFCVEKNIPFFRGSEENVLERYYLCAKEFGIENIIRVTSDCPLIDPKIVNKLIQLFENKKLDYSDLKQFPRGINAEIFTFSTLEKAYLNSNKKYEFEHVTPYIYLTNKKKFKIDNLKSEQKNDHIRITLDTEEDYMVLKKIFTSLKDKEIHLKDIIKLFKVEKKIFEINKNIKQKSIMN